MLNEGVYFILARQVNSVKIGYSTDVQKRLGALQVASPFKLVLLAVAEGGVALEKELHERFSECRTSGEWFEYSEKLKQYVPDFFALEPMSPNTYFFLKMMRRMSMDDFNEAVDNISNETGKSPGKICRQYERLSTELSTVVE